MLPWLGRGERCNDPTLASCSGKYFMYNKIHVYCIHISTLAGCSGKLKLVSGSKSGQLLLMLAEAATSEAKDLRRASMFAELRKIQSLLSVS